MAPKSYSLRSAWSGESKLARRAGINEAINAEELSARIAKAVTAGSYGFIP